MAGRIDDRQLADEGCVEEGLDGFGKGGHSLCSVDRYSAPQE
jgi:hypothetical protein